MLFYCANTISGGKTCSWVMDGKALNQLDCRFFEHISPDGMAGSHWFFVYKQITKRGTKSPAKIFVGCYGQRLIKSWSVTENSTERKIM